MSSNDEGAPGKRPRSGPDYKVAQDRQKAIGDQLRQIFDQVVNEPVPDEFLKLLEEADAAAEQDDPESTSGAKKGADDV